MTTEQDIKGILLIAGNTVTVNNDSGFLWVKTGWLDQLPMMDFYRQNKKAILLDAVFNLNEGGSIYSIEVDYGNGINVWIPNIKAKKVFDNPENPTQALEDALVWVVRKIEEEK